MSVREFWEEEPDLLWTYRKSYMGEIEVKREMANYNAWLNGLYVFDAISKSIYNSFGRKNGQQIMTYVEKPYDFNEKAKSKEEIEQEQRLKVEEQIKERNRQIREMLKNKK